MSRVLKVIVLAAFLCILLPVQAFAGILVMVDGKPLGTQDEPAFLSGKLMVPMRVIFEKFGANVSWDNGSIIATMGETDIRLKINNLHARLNNRPHILPVAPTVINGKTMVPLRFVSETLNADVDYLHHHQIVFITSDKYKKGLKSDDSKFRDIVEKYYGYKNLTMTNEKSIATYLGVKESTLKDFRDLKNYEDRISVYIKANDAKAIELSLTILKEVMNTNERVKTRVIETLKPAPLTNQLGKDLENYSKLILNVYTSLAEGKKISDTVKNVLENIALVRQDIEVDINEIERNISDKFIKGRSGI